MELSNRQRQTINIALTILASVVIIAAMLGLFWILAKFVQTFSHVFLPLLVAGIASLVFQPYYAWLRKRLPGYAAISALILTIIIPIGFFVVFFGTVIGSAVVDSWREFESFRKGEGDYEKVHQWFEETWPDVQSFFREHPIGQKASETFQNIGPMLSSAAEYLFVGSVAAGGSVARMSGAVLSWAVAPVYFVFFLMMEQKEVRKLEHYLPFLKPETRNDVVFLVNEFVNIMVAFFRGQIVIAFLQGVLLAVGFSIVGLKYGLLLGFLVGFLNVIPYLGSMIGLTITLPLAYFQDLPVDTSPGRLAGVIVVLLAVQTIEGYILTPKIMGERTGLHPMAIIFAVFFWGAALGGIMGMILAIPLTAFIVVFWRLMRDKYISELV